VDRKFSSAHKFPSGLRDPKLTVNDMVRERRVVHAGPNALLRNTLGW
jgi:hypothetical protein